MTVNLSASLFCKNKPAVPPINPLIPIVYEDDWSVVFNKPSSLLVVPTDKNEKNTLVALVNEQYPQMGELLPAHRLDRNTTGAILFAKGKANQELLMNLFKEKKVEKTYIAFVHGKVEQANGKITIPVKDFHRRQFAKHLPAQSALTYYEVDKYYKDFTSVFVVPVTGRTNQIRIHFSKIGHPLVGEDVYAFRRDFALRFRRYALHAWRLTFPQVETGKKIFIEVPLADDMKEFLTKQ